MQACCPSGTVLGVSVSVLATSNGGSYTPGTWADHPVSVTFTCSFDLTFPGPYSEPCGTYTYTTDTSGATVVSTLQETAGGPPVTGQTTFGPINVDVSRPLMYGATSTSPNINGWYDAPATVHWTCIDGPLGVPSCPADTILSSDGFGQSTSRTFTDQGGNPVTSSVSGINIDRTPPTGTVTATNSDGSPYTFGTITNEPVNVHFFCKDSLSGPVQSDIPESTEQLGANQTISVVCRDLAGNTTTVTSGTISIAGDPSAAVSLSPNPVVYGRNAVLTWASTGNGQSQVYVSVDGAPDVLVAGGQAGSAPIPWITLGHSYVFSLFAGTVHQRLLAQTNVTATDTASVDVTPNPVQAPSTVARVLFSTGNGSVGQLYVSVDGGWEILVSEGTGGSMPVPWISPGHTCTFTLYAGIDHAVAVARRSVTVTGNLTLTASPAAVHAPSTNSSITWDTPDGLPGEVFVSVDGGTNYLFAAGPSGTAFAPWILPGHTYVFTLYEGTPSPLELAQTTVTGS